MELTLTQKQKKQLDNGGLMSAKTLQRVFKKSVQDQQKIIKQAAKIKAKQK